MKHTAVNLHRILPLYLPFLVLSAASAFMVYLGLLTEARRLITCHTIFTLSDCSYTYEKTRASELVAELIGYSWFILSQAAFRNVYQHHRVYSARAQKVISVRRVASSAFCLAVTTSGFVSIILFTWNLGASSH